MSPSTARSTYSELLNSLLPNTIFYCRLERMLLQSGSRQVGSSRKLDDYSVVDRLEFRLRHQQGFQVFKCVLQRCSHSECIPSVTDKCVNMERIGGMLLRRERRSSRNKLSHCDFVHQKAHVDWDLNQTSDDEKQTINNIRSSIAIFIVFSFRHCKQIFLYNALNQVATLYCRILAN